MAKRIQWMAAVLLLVLTGCGSTADITGQQQTAELEYQFLPLTERLYGSNVTEEALTELSSCYETLRTGHSKVLEAMSQQNEATPVNMIPEDVLLPLSNYSPAAMLLCDAEHLMKINPALVMRQVLSGTTEFPVTAAEMTTDSSDAMFRTHPEQHYSAKEEWISACLQEGYYDMPFEVGYSSFEDLYYVYLYDAREALVAAAIYFRFDEEGMLSSVGYDCITYDPYEITFLLDSDRHLSLDAAASVPFSGIRELLLPMLGAVPEGQKRAFAYRTGYTCKSERQCYYIGEESQENLLAVRSNEWFVFQEHKLV